MTTCLLYQLIITLEQVLNEKQKIMKMMMKMSDNENEWGFSLIFGAGPQSWFKFVFNSICPDMQPGGKCFVLWGRRKMV